MRKPSLFISAAEHSAEIYACEIVRKLRKELDITLFGIGGEKLRKAGVEIIYSNSRLHLGGIIEVFPAIPRAFKLLHFLIQEILRRGPELVFLIDFPDFHLILAKKLKKHNFKGKIFHFISPTIWAWRKGRIKKIKKYIDMELLIFPFEQQIYQRWKVPHKFVGHPLFEIVKPSLSEEDFYRKYNLKRRPVIGLLPGSRPQEIKRHMPLILKTVDLLKESIDAEFLLIRAESVKELLKSYPLHALKIVGEEDKYSAMAYSNLLLSASGTATLEACLLETPVVVFYKVSPFTYIFKPLVKLKNYSIVNILAGEELVKELIQKKFTPENLCREALRLLNSPEERERILKGYRRIKKFFPTQPAVEKIVELIKDVY